MRRRRLGNSSKRTGSTGTRRSRLPTFNGPKASVGIGMEPDDENHSDHGNDHRLVAFPQDLREGKHHERWGLTKHGKLIGAPKAASSASSSTKAVKKKKKIRKKYEVGSDDEVEAEEMDTGKVQWMEVDEAYVRNNRGAIPQDEYLAALAAFDDVPSSMKQCAFIAAHRAPSYMQQHRKGCKCGLVYKSRDPSEKHFDILDVPIEKWQKAHRKIVDIFRNESDKRLAAGEARKLKEKYYGNDFSRSGIRPILRKKPAVLTHPRSCALTKITSTRITCGGLPDTSSIASS